MATGPGSAICVIAKRLFNQPLGSLRCLAAVQKQVPPEIVSIFSLGGHIATSGCRSLSQSSAAIFFEHMIIKNLTVAGINDHII